MTVTIEILLLGLGSALRPSSFVAVFALVRQHSPRRLLIAFVVAGLVFSLAVGVAAVWIFSGINLSAGSDRTRAIAEVIAGALALVLGAAVFFGGLPLVRLEEDPQAAGAWGRLSGRHITTRAAALAGPATHIPGLLYILALDLIVAQEPGLAGGIVEIGIYNALWFVIPLLVLVVCIFDPPAARVGVERLQSWVSRRARMLVLLMCFGLGGFLFVKGIVTL